jgi:hypothetical protein
MLKAGNGPVAEVLLAIRRYDLPRALRDGCRKGDLVVLWFVLLDGGGGFVDKPRGFCLEVSAIRPSLLPGVWPGSGCLGRGGR